MVSRRLSSVGALPATLLSIPPLESSIARTLMRWRRRPRRVSRGRRARATTGSFIGSTPSCN
jgi:hypothetical protein